jgi:hypothetical protein
VANLQQDQCKPSASHQLGFHKVMDLVNISELFHQLRKRFGLSIPRKHSAVHHGQGTSAELKKFSDPSSTILESNDLSGAILASPKITAILIGKLEKDLNPHVNALIFSNNINKGA